MNEICDSNGISATYVTAKAIDRSDEWEGIRGKSYISPEKLQLAAEALQAASSQPQNPAA